MTWNASIMLAFQKDNNMPREYHNPGELNNMKPYYGVASYIYDDTYKGYIITADFEPINYRYIRMTVHLKNAQYDFNNKVRTDYYKTPAEALSAAKHLIDNTDIEANGDIPF